jgi:hypothetical protein
MYTSGSQFAGARTLAKALRVKAGHASVRIGTSLAAEPIINYYRARYGQSNWQPVERQPSPAPTISTSSPPPTLPSSTSAIFM